MKMWNKIMFKSFIKGTEQNSLRFMWYRIWVTRGKQISFLFFIQFHLVLPQSNNFIYFAIVCKTKGRESFVNFYYSATLLEEKIKLNIMFFVLFLSCLMCYLLCESLVLCSRLRHQNGEMYWWRTCLCTYCMYGWNRRILLSKITGSQNTEDYVFMYGCIYH